MASPHEKLASSLKALKRLQDDNRHIFQSKELSRVHRERLLKNGFLKEIVKGWSLSSSPSETSGESTSWYANFWEFCALYCRERFADHWHLSPEQSLLIYAGSTAIPSQVIIYTPKGNNNLLKLPFQTSLYDFKSESQKENSQMTVQNALRLYPLELALIKASPSFYMNHPLEAQLALSQVKNIAVLTRPLLEGEHSVIAGRLAGGFERIGKNNMAREIIETMRSAGYVTHSTDPFSKTTHIISPKKSLLPFAGRIQGLWETYRQIIIDNSPAPFVPLKDPNLYLEKIDELYKADAYHSLSIEGYSVSPELIEQVSSGQWHANDIQGIKHSKDALAARGYWQAFQLVKQDVSKILDGKNPGEIIQKTHNNWYRELFQPSVQAGIISASSLAGYRDNPVYLRNSRHVPPRSEVVYEAMEVLFDQIITEEHPGVKAILGHWLFGYIHPYPDGNGRIARFLMNALLASGGYSWTIITVENRSQYLASLESASVEGDIKPFVNFISSQMQPTEK